MIYVSTKTAVALLAAIVALVYYPIVFNGWAYEDPRMLGGLLLPIDWSSALRPSRLLSNLSFKATAALTEQPNPTVFHAASVAIHLLNCALIGVLSHKLGARTWLAAVLFAVNPVVVEAVVYAAARTDLIATTFTLTACLSVAGCRSTPPLSRLLTATFAVWLTLISKESAAGVILVVPIVWLYSDPGLEWRKLTVIGIPILVVSAYAFYHRPVWPEAADSVLDYTWVEYASYQAGTIYDLAARTLIPLSLTADFDAAALSPLIRYFALLIVVAVLPIYAFTSPRRSYPVLFAIAFAVASVAPRFLVRTNEWVSEHHFYLAVAGIAMAVSVKLEEYVGRKTR